MKRFSAAIGVLFFSLLASRQPCRATEVSLPINSAETSVFDAVGSSRGLRVLKLNLNDEKLTALSSVPLAAVDSLGLNTNSPGFFSDVLFFSSAINTWAYAPTTPLIVGCQGGATADGMGGSALTAMAEMLVMVGTNVSDELANVIVPILGDTDFPGYLFKDVAVGMTITSGPFQGRTVQLKGEMAYASGPDPNNDDSGEAWAGDMFLAMDWGCDPLGNRECVLLRLTYSAGDTTSDSTCLNLQGVAQHFFGTMSTGAYFSPRWNNLLGEVANQTLHIEGPLPDLLFLYDFSGADSCAPARTLPPGQLDPDTVLPLQYAPDEKVYGYFNQYDAGVASNLPKRFNQPNPIPPPSGLTPGGNACGPTSLQMLLYETGLSTVDLRQVYDNTTVSGLAAGDGAKNPFDFPKAQDWLAGRHDYTFHNPSPLPAQSRISYRYAQSTSSASAGNLIRSWRDIDTLLANKQPVEIRTDLGLGTSPGGGHCIILLGLGHNPDLGKLYGTSGDYYIVADPAGHWFGNSTGTHYGTVDQLRYQDVGITYGGWFAMYPKELLRKHIYDKTHHIYRVTAITIGSRFHNANITLTLHSPLTLLVTDPLGRQTGVTTNRVVLQDIPASYFEPAVADEEELGDSTFVPDGPKSVELDDPLDGVYQIQLVATNSGPYTFEWEIDNPDGSPTDSQVFTNTISTGDRLNFSLSITNGGTPRLEFLKRGNALELWWPTNATGCVLQTTTKLGALNAWTDLVTPGFTTNGEFVLTNSTSDAERFYRLKL